MSNNENSEAFQTFPTRKITIASHNYIIKLHFEPYETDKLVFLGQFLLNFPFLGSKLIKIIIVLLYNHIYVNVLPNLEK